MSRERAQRRAEREREAAVRAAARAAEAERAQRRAARQRALTSWWPQARSQPTGIIAERRRQQIGLVIALLVAAVVLVYAFSESWALTAMTSVAALLGAPVLHTMMFRK
ncbi:MAG: hypothetical protein WKF79_09535, partial [Nocardioides sp.]